MTRPWRHFAFASVVRALGTVLPTRRGTTQAVRGFGRVGGGYTCVPALSNVYGSEPGVS